MAWITFFETLRRGWRTMTFWGLGIGLMAMFAIIAIPDVKGLQATADALAKMPPLILQMVGGGDLKFLASPEGYLNNQYYAIILVIFGVYGIIVGLNITANDEEKGIMDMVLSMPVPRWRILLEKFLAYSVLSAGVIGLSTAIIWAVLQMTPVMNVPLGTLLAVSFVAWPSLVLIVAFTTFVATLVRRRSQAIGLAAAFLIGSWFIDVLGRTAPASFIGTARVASFYAYYDTQAVFQHGLSATMILVPLVGAAALLIGAVWLFEQRNLNL